MPRLEVTDAKLRYCGQMVRRLRHEHQMAFAAVGLNPHRELRNTVSSSSEARAAFLDGELVGMWGVVGTLMCPWGFVWLCMSQEATKHPMRALRLARSELDRFMRTRTELFTTVLEGDEAALRLCAFLGFHVEHQGPGAPPVSKDGRRAWMRYVRNNPDFRMPVGRSYAVKVGYHPPVDPVTVQ